MTLSVDRWRILGDQRWHNSGAPCRYTSGENTWHNLGDQTRYIITRLMTTPERVQQLEQELAEKTRALAELGVSFALLEKKERAESRSRSQAKGSRRRNAK